MAPSEDIDVAMVIRRAPLGKTPIRDACSNSECIAMVTSKRRVYVCDLTDANEQQKYVKVNFTTSEGDDESDVDIVSVCCGRHHFLALSARGQVYSWGNNNFGQLGFPKKKQRRYTWKVKEKEAPKPRRIIELSSCDVIKIACGGDHSLALTRDGLLFSWGRNGYGQLSIGEERRTRHHNAKPTQVEGLADVRMQHIAAGGAHTAVVSDSGSVYVWGRNSHGQLGLGIQQEDDDLQGQDVMIPIKLKPFREKVKSISCGENSTSFLLENGELCVLGMGVGMHPHKWYKTELIPGRTDRSHLYSSLQSYGRYTFVVEESSGRPFVLDHGKVGRLDGPSQYLQLDPLEETPFADVFGPQSLPEWPPRWDDADVELYTFQKVKVQKDESVGIGAGVVGNQDNNHERRPRIFIIQHKMSSASVRSEMPTLSIELLQDLSDVDETISMEVNEDASLQEAKIIFSSPACLSASFPTTGPQEVNGLNMDLKSARNAFNLIIRKKKLLAWISKFVRVDLCRHIQLGHWCDEDLRFYLILLECPVFRYPESEWCLKVLTAIGNLMIHDSGNGNHLSRLVSWWKFEPLSFRETVVTYREAVSMFAKRCLLLVKRKDDFKTYLEVLQCLNQINIQHNLVSRKTFYITATDLTRLDRFIYSRWKGYSWMPYLFFIDLKDKANLLERNHKREQEIARKPEWTMMKRLLYFFNYFRHLVPPIPPMPHPHLELVVKRDDIFGRSVREQLANMLRLSKSTLKKPLIVKFEGEIGIDQGALSIEFFRLVFDELLDPEKNVLFRYINEHDPTQSHVWFREDCPTNDTAMMCGLLFGLSLFNNALVPLPAFPQLLYAKLLGKGPGEEIEEIEELDKDFADQMSKLLSAEEELLSELELELELENGDGVEVSKANVHLYVKKKVRDYLAPSQFAAFQQGFNKVCDTKGTLGIFRPVELEALVTGEKYFNWVALEKSTRYDWPYTDSHSTIKMFWEVFHALDDDQKRKFLVFVAGSDRVPVGGLQNLGLTIVELQIPLDNDHDDEEASEDRLSRLCPVAHCCDHFFLNHILELPMYPSKKIVKDRVMTTLSFCNCPFHTA